jgi:ribosomal protein L29
VPTPTPHPAADALGAVDGVSEAIDAARGEGLRGRDANELVQLLAETEAALLDLRFDRARDRAERLERIVDDLDDVDDDEHEDLLDAVRHLREVIP